MNPINEGVHTPVSQTTSINKKKSSGNSAIISFAAFIIFALGVIVFLYNQNQSLKTKLAKYETTTTLAPTPVPSASPTPEQPIVTTPSVNSKVKSPLKVTGAVPAGWMNEGVFPIKLLDSEGNVIAQTSAKETVEGSWQSGKPSEFTATLIFKTASGSGIIVLTNDNPSGNPDNAKSFEVSVKF